MRCATILARVAIIVFGLIAATPAVLFASNYALCIPYARWFCEFHARPGIETTAGLVAGILGVMYASAKLRPGRLNTPVLAACTLITIGLVVTPFAKQLFSAADYTSLQDKWKYGICLQTSSYTCVPACSATVVKMQGGNLTEPQLARCAGTTRTGTESWYLMRALRRRGFEPEFERTKNIQDAPVRSILGVHLGSIGHVVVLLSKDKHGLTIAEPLRGRCRYSWSAFKRCYKPDGTYVTINKLDNRQQD